MMNREDMLELTRRMTTDRTSFTRVAGCYLDGEGFVDGTFNTNFLKLPLKERQKQLLLAREIPFAPTNENLKEYVFPETAKGKESLWQLLQAMKSCGLKNDALLDTFYDLVAEKYQTDHEYAIYVYHDCYDVPMKAADKERLGESEEVYTYLICTICPLSGEYEPGKPECGFLFPSFRDRSSDDGRVAIFDRDTSHPHEEIRELLMSK
ncbi:MAG: DUF4317 family protein [Lachnospiraceae bacterium]|nr:DUF4317 family protein [Lachnospiraceae bacterium]